jgi:hypothetical protein
MPNQLKTNTRPLVVASGGTSGFCELEDFPMLGLEIPTLDSTTLEIRGSNDNVTYRKIYDGTGTQVLVWTASTGDRDVATRDLADVAGYNYIGVFLGTAQTAARTCTLSFRRPKVG